jgi:ankyrin repeat protein
MTSPQIATIMEFLDSSKFDKANTFIIESNLNVDVRCGPHAGGSTLLHYYSHKGNSVVVEQLLKWGANPSQQTGRDGYSPICLAHLGRHIDTMYFLITYGANLDLVDDDIGAVDLHRVLDLVGRFSTTQLAKINAIRRHFGQTILR